MGLREDAIAAAEAAAAAAVAAAVAAAEAAAAAAAAVAAGREAAARLRLATVLAPTDVDGLDVVATLPSSLVFSGDGVCLAVRDSDQRVSLVVDSDGWTLRGVVTSLAGLGELLAGGA